MTTPEVEAEIIRLYFAEHWRVGTIAAQLGTHPDVVRRVLGLCDGFGIGRETLHYEVEVVDPRRRRRGLGSFRDLRQLSLRGGR